MRSWEFAIGKQLNGHEEHMKVLRGCWSLARGSHSAAWNGPGRERGATHSEGDATSSASTGDVGGHLLLLGELRVRVLEDQRVLARVERWLRLVGLALVQHADRAVLTDPVAHLRRVNPHGQLRRKQPVQHRWQQPHVGACLRDHRVHLAVDADAPVTRSTVRPVREPVVAVPSAQFLRN